MKVLPYLVTASVTSHLSVHESQEVTGVHGCWAGSGDISFNTPTEY